MGDFDNEGRDPVDRLLGRIGHLKSRNGTGQTAPTATPSASNRPTKEVVDAPYNIPNARHQENMCLLLQDYVLKSRHVARETRYDRWGPTRPTHIEPAALQLTETMEAWNIDWRRVPYREEYLEELDFIWRDLPETRLRGVQGHKAIWEYVTGLARKWDHRRWGQRKENTGKNYQLLKHLQVPTVPQMIRRNRFIGFGDESTACICPDGVRECVRRCVYL